MPILCYTLFEEAPENSLIETHLSPGSLSARELCVSMTRGQGRRYVLECRERPHLARILVEWLHRKRRGITT